MKPSRANEALLTQESLRQRLRYDEETGAFTWIETKAHFIRGKTAGTPHNGHIVIIIGGISYYAHRLVWLYVHGEWPADQVDHINGRRSDNRIVNLRQADYTLNARNRRGVQRNNRAGVAGVSVRRKGFAARITVDKQTITLGTFDTPDAAGAAYAEAKRRLHPGCTA